MHVCNRYRVIMVKIKYLQDAIQRSRSLRWSNFPCPWSQAYALCRWALSQLHILRVAWLLPTPQIIHLRCAHKNLQTFACFVPLIIHNFTKRGAPICPTEETTKIPTFKAPEIPTLFLPRLLNFRQLVLFSFLVKIGHFEGINKVFEKCL